jgi:hypothetical protein
MTCGSASRDDCWAGRIVGVWPAIAAAGVVLLPASAYVRSGWMRSGHRVLSAGLRRSGGSADGVRGCPCDGPPGRPWARTYSGQRRCRGCRTAAFTQVIGCMVGIGAEHCKTVGSAYVGSNPTPATTCENGPLAGNSRLCGPFLLCPAMCHLVPPWTAVSRCPRTYSGRRPAPGTVGVHRRLSTDGHGRAAPVAGSGLT